MLLLNSIRNGDLNRLDVEKIIIVIVMGCCFQNFDTFGQVLFVPSFWCRPFFERVPKKERHQKDGTNCNGITIFSFLAYDNKPLQQ